MPFSARVGFFTVSGVAPPPAAPINWYEYDRANYEPISESLTGGTINTSTDVNMLTVPGLGKDTGNPGYRSAVAHPNGNIYCFPDSNTGGVLEIDPADPSNPTKLTFGSLANITSGSRLFHSACLTESGNILAVPFNYDYIVQMDPVNQTATEFAKNGRNTGNPTTDGAFTASVQFTGAVLAPNGNVIAIPQQYGQFLDIDPVNETVTETTFGMTIGAGNQFFGGCRSFLDDRIYPAPIGYDKIVGIDAVAKTYREGTYSQSWPTGNNHYGVCADKFGRIIYPGGESGVPNRIFDPESNTASTFTTTGYTTARFYGGVQGADGNVYTIVKSGSGTLKISFTSNTDTSPGVTEVNSTNTERMGGVTALNGNTYIMSDTAADTMLEINTLANTSIDNFANVVMTTYMNPGRI